MMLTRKSPGHARRLAGAAVVAALGIGTGSTAAAAPDPQLTNAQPPAVAPEAAGYDSRTVVISQRRIERPASEQGRADSLDLNAALGLPADARTALRCVRRQRAGSEADTQCSVGVPGGPMTDLPPEVVARLSGQNLTFDKSNVGPPDSTGVHIFEFLRTPGE